MSKKGVQVFVKKQKTSKYSNYKEHTGYCFYVYIPN